MWLFHYLARHPELTEEAVPDNFFHAERIRAIAGAGLYLVGGVIGLVVNPLLGMLIFLALPLFYGVTSSGLNAARARTGARMP